MYFIFTVQIHGLKPISFPDLELMYRIQDLKYIGPCPAQYGRTRALFKAPPLWSGARAHWSTAHTTTAKPPLPFPSSWGWRMGGCLDGRGEEKYRAIYSLWLLLAWFFFFFFATLPSRPSVSCLQHDTSAQLVFSALEVCVWSTVGFNISSRVNAL